MFRSTWRFAALALLAGTACAGARADPGASPPFTVALHGDRLSVRVEGVPLVRVLEELRRQAGIETEFLGAPPSGVIWQTFSDLPLEEALSSLLGGHSYALYYAMAPAQTGAATAPESLRLLIVPPPTRLPDTPVVARIAPGGAPAAVDNPATNSTLDTPLILHPAGSLDALAQAMVDPDENVRARAQQAFERALAARGETAADPPRPLR